MDDRFRERVQGFVEQLLKEEKSSLRKAQTFLEIENLAVEVRDEVARQLAGGGLSRRSQEAVGQGQFRCPECGRMCAVEADRESLILPGGRGEIEYSEPRCHCRSCRRDFFPVARQIQRPVRETLTPAIAQRVVWAGANLGSFSQASDAFKMLAGLDLSAKRVRRITRQIGQDRLEERQQQVAEFVIKPLMERLSSPAGAESPALGAAMPDGGRYQRLDHFGEEDYEGSHWKEDKVGIVLHMDSQIHASDLHPEFSQWRWPMRMSCGRLPRWEHLNREKTGIFPVLRSSVTRTIRLHRAGLDSLLS